MLLILFYKPTFSAIEEASMQYNLIFLSAICFLTRLGKNFSNFSKESCFVLIKNDAPGLLGLKISYFYKKLSL